LRYQLVDPAGEEDLEKQKPQKKEITMKNIICLTVRSAIAAGVLSLGEEIFRCTRTFEKIPRRRKRNMETARTHSLWNRARVLGGSAALLLVSTLASNALAQQCLKPPPGQVFEDFYHPFVNVYTGPDHTGPCRTIPINSTIANLGDPYWGLNNTIRSAKVGRSVRLRLFDGTNFSGDWWWWETSPMGLGRAWNARASSLRVEDRAIKPDCSNLPSNTVAIYEHSDFRGDCRVLSPGRYDGAAEMGFENDSISSVRNRAGFVVLYPHNDFDLSCPWWDWSCERALGIMEGDDYPYVGDDANDATTSIIISDHSPPTPRRGRTPVLPQM
jgi:hypothetical protein